MAAAAELILGAMLPVFSLEHFSIDPETIVALANIQLPAGTNSLAIVATLPDAPPIWEFFLLGCLPVLFIGVSNVVMAFGICDRAKASDLGCGIVAICGCVWAGVSKSLNPHLPARCVQAIGAGTVESLIPFVIPDLTFDHQRNTWMSYVFATQGIIIVGLGFATPHIIIFLSWRWVDFTTAIGAATFIVIIVVFPPEIKWYRSSDEINGVPRDGRGTTYLRHS
ncbi:hypothetical protein AMS68_006433 [Peltaster fructicola]|uniref:Major facilitator superfamily (MFS) profile domain-containing protein n=1 Tax=Peltaster fructicola TaxID=286661 RepID=A0A6H0Y1U6_9PEZI|nr:hypothetical protein AMS68_006433 [Peltaster fructicola]